jgi:hypothetical protein
MLVLRSIRFALLLGTKLVLHKILLGPISLLLHKHVGFITCI